jgi:hypothetical protein
MSRRRLGPDFEAVARTYGVSSRAVRRWHASGCDLGDPLAVSEHLLRMRRPSPAAVKAAAEMLKQELTSIP